MKRKNTRDLEELKRKHEERLKREVEKNNKALTRIRTLEVELKEVRKEVMMRIRMVWRSFV